MPAGVEQAMDVAAHVAVENHGTPRDPAGHEIVGLLQLGGMADIDPAFQENMGNLVPEHRFGNQGFAVEQEPLFDRVIDDIAAGHGYSQALVSHSSVRVSAMLCRARLWHRSMHDTVKDTHWHEPKSGENAGTGTFKRPKLPYDRFMEDEGV